MADYFTTFVFAVASVGLWTLRVAMTAAGRRLFGSIVAAIEGVTYVAVFSQLVGTAGSPSRLAVYGIGVGTGTFLGLGIDKRLKASRGKTPTKRASGAPTIRSLCQVDRPTRRAGETPEPQARKGMIRPRRRRTNTHEGEQVSL